ncbi:hypothetical protein L1987_48805 [Smallanthus sonchifolius]|uniref:Uncharacterized protein n=1 Tax=Smallanthus sonchifolius TaxID=185202 RepID=A0ACB9FSS3_9ASTR|nr:hypothetical protein L1987_48805 [Smallanthus sonchifolius]
MNRLGWRCERRGDVRREHQRPWAYGLIANMLAGYKIRYRTEKALNNSIHFNTGRRISLMISLPVVRFQIQQGCK